MSDAPRPDRDPTGWAPGSPPATGEPLRAAADAIDRAVLIAGGADKPGVAMVARSAVADALAELATATRAPQFRWAVTTLASDRRGRRRIDDDAAVAEVVALVESGRCRSVRQAADKVARAVAVGSGSVEATAVRLRARVRDRKKLGR